MTEPDLQTEVHAVLQRVVPVAPDQLDPEEPLRDQFEMDSLDFLNFVVALEKEYGVRIPEVRYPRCATLGGAVEVLEEARQAAGAT